METPWGQSQVIEKASKVADDILFVSTAGHGGFFVPPERNAKIPEYMRERSGWYEEDEDWSVVVVSFPELFPDENVAQAKNTLRNWKPGAYEAFYGQEIQPGESYVKDQAIFLHENRNEYIAIAAYGDGHENVPKGTVVVFAGKGGRTPPQWRVPKDTAHFLVSEKEYDARSHFGFVIDPKRHKRIKY